MADSTKIGVDYEKCIRPARTGIQHPIEELIWNSVLPMICFQVAEEQNQ